MTAPTYFPHLLPPGELQRQLEHARSAVVRADYEWRQVSGNGSREAPDEQAVGAIRAWVAEFDHRARVGRSELRRLWMTMVFLRLIRALQAVAAGVQHLLGLKADHWWASGLLIGAALTIPFAVLYGVLRLPALSFVALFLTTFALLAVLLVAMTKPAQASAVVERLVRNRERARAVGEQVAGANAQRIRLAEQLRGAEEARRRYGVLVAAREEFKRLQDALNDQRYQLLHTDWRGLRGVPFEQFLERVFQLHGYEVQSTKASGDQGVDLIVTGKGRRIAVQAKGYDGSVGNKAVQEVYAGMAFYKCQECVVITNSQFTSGAEELAVSVGCRLIDGTLIPSLIEGRVY